MGSDTICVFCNVQWSNMAVLAVFLALAAFSLASLFSALLGNFHKQHSHASFKAICVAGVLTGVFKCVQLSLSGNWMDESPLINNTQPAFTVIFLTAPRISTAALTTFYTAVLYMWYSAYGILQGAQAPTRSERVTGAPSTSARLLGNDDRYSGELELTIVNTPANKSTPLFIRLISGLLAFEYAFVLACTLAGIWQNQEDVTAADEIKDVVIYLIYVMLLTTYAYKLCTALASLSKGLPSCRVCMRQICPAVVACCPGCYPGSGSELPTGMSATETLQYIVREQADQKIAFVATVSVLVAFGVLIRFIKCVFVALIIIERHPVIPQNPASALEGAGWLLYYLLGEITPFVAVYILTLKAKYFRTICCMPHIPDSEIMSPSAALAHSQPKHHGYGHSHGKDGANNNNNNSGKGMKGNRMMSPSFLEDGNSGAGGYTDLLSHEWGVHRDSSAELMRGYDYIDTGV